METWQSYFCEGSFFTEFMPIDLFFGVWAAWRAGSAIARQWHSSVVLFIYMLIFGAGLRFLHSALFDGTFLDLYYYGVDSSVVLIAAFVGLRYERALNMTRQYGFLYEKMGGFGWKLKDNR